MSTDSDKQPNSCGPLSFRAAATLLAQYKALQNDVFQARLLITDYQGQLAAKTNECALLRQSLQVDLSRSRTEIATLRQECAAQVKQLARVAELEAIVFDLTRELETLRGQLSERSNAGLPHSAPGSDTVVTIGLDPTEQERIFAKRILAKVWTTVERLRGVIDPAVAESTESPR